MDDVTASFESLLRQRFHITPTVTSRRDQWFKRIHQYWIETDRKLLLLTPTTARNEWAPEMLRFCAQFARYIQTQAAAERGRLDAAFTPSAEKLFHDAVFGEPPLLCPVDDQQAPPLSTRVQRADWWLGKDNVDMAYVGKALLEREQAAALIYLCGMRKVGFADAADSTGQRRDRWVWPTRTGPGWATMVDEALQVFFFAAVLGTFSDDLLSPPEKYKDWLPWGELLSDFQPPMRFVRELESRRRFRGLHGADDLRPHMARCVRILVTAETVYTSCALPVIDWEARISSALLYFVGFEAWNRTREDECYLPCPFNTTKDEAWLTTGLKEVERQQRPEKEDGQDEAAKTRLVRPRDPLRLREPKVEMAESEDEDEEAKQLAEMERAEAEYGSRRSTKYIRRKVNK